MQKTVAEGIAITERTHARGVRALDELAFGERVSRCRLLIGAVIGGLVLKIARSSGDRTESSHEEGRADVKGVDTGAVAARASPERAQLVFGHKRRRVCRLGDVPRHAHLLPPEVAESSAASVTLPIKASEVKPMSGRIFKFGSRPGIPIRTESGELRAFSAICTHLNCTVQFREDLGHLWCACHNGHFDLSGRNISGPPPAAARFAHRQRAGRSDRREEDRMNGLRAWLDERIGLGELERLARHKQVPIHRHAVYYLGGMTLFLFGVQVATGILLLFYYRPSAEEAYESVQFLMAEVQFGWLIRSIHAWSANLMIFTLFLHMLSALLESVSPAARGHVAERRGAVRPGARLRLTCYLLPWNTLALFATKVGTDIPGVLPIVGGFVRKLLRGGDDVTGATLTRFYGIHVAVLPAFTTLFLGLHLLLVQRHGMSVPPSVEREGTRRVMPFLPNFLLRDAVGWLTAVAALAALAAFYPTELGEKADPFAPAPAGIKPEWNFMFMFQTLKYLPGHILGLEGEMVGVIAFGVAGGLLAAVPLLDRRAARGEPGRLVGILTVGAILYIILLTTLGYTASPTVVPRFCRGGRTAVEAMDGTLGMALHERCVFVANGELQAEQIRQFLESAGIPQHFAG